MFKESVKIRSKAFDRNDPTFQISRHSERRFICRQNESGLNALQTKAG